MPTVSELSATPEEILADRSLYVPAEPAHAEFVNDFWEELVKHGYEQTLSSSVANQIRWEERRSDANTDQLRAAVSLQGLEWYIHTHQEELVEKDINRPSSNTVYSGVVGGLITHLAETVEPVSLPLQGTIVIPITHDGWVGQVHPYIASPKRPIDITYIGNVGDNFASGVRADTKITLYGSTGRMALNSAGKVDQRNKGTKKSPIVTVHGDVGKAAGWSASLLNLRVTGNAEDELMAGAYAPSTPILARVEGQVGKKVADEAFGKVFVSVGSMGSLGDVKDLSGVVEVGPNRPGRNRQIHPRP